jgi:magnesium chelatase family protein
VTLAHRGVLFLDEFPEFSQSVLEAPRQPMEDRTVTLSRVRGSVGFPASFMMVAAMNPCPCGWRGDPRRQCTCAVSAVTRYRRRISGPLLDRIDILVDVPRVEYEKLTAQGGGERSDAVQQRMEEARERQRRRFADTPYFANTDMGPGDVWTHCRLSPEVEGMARVAMEQFQLSARAFHRSLKVARTIADLARSETIALAHLAEAVRYRQRGLG